MPHGNFENNCSLTIVIACKWASMDTTLLTKQIHDDTKVSQKLWQSLAY